MNILLDVLIITIVLLSLFAVGSNRLGSIINFFRIQSIILGFVPVIMYIHDVKIHIIFVSLVAILIKGFLMPYFLFWAIRHVSIRRELDPIIGYGTTLILSGLLIAGSFFISSKLQFPFKVISDLLIPISFSVIMMGFLLLISRAKAISQVVGYLLMENGIYLFSLLLLESTPLLVEMGIFLDIFVGTLIMGIVVNNISEEFEQTDTSHMTTLKE